MASGILFITKISPGCLGLSFAVRHLHGLWSRLATRRPECLWKCSSRWAGQASREPWGVVGGSTSVLFLLLHQQPARKNALRTHGQPPLPTSALQQMFFQGCSPSPLPNLQPVGWGQQPGCQAFPRQCNTHCGGAQGVSKVVCPHTDTGIYSTRPMWSQTWPCWEDLTLKRWRAPVNRTCAGSTQGQQWLLSLQLLLQRHSVQSFPLGSWGPRLPLPPAETR